MQDTLNISWQVYAYTFLIIFIFPVFVTIGSEYLLTQAISKKIAVFVVLLSCLLLLIAYIQLWSSKVNMTGEAIQLKSTFYNKTIANDDGNTIRFYENKLPEEYKLKIRINGLALPGYKIGSFIMKNGEPVFVMISQPPYLFISEQNAKKHYIFSVNDKILPLVSNYQSG